MSDNQPTQALPIFYSRPILLRFEEHKQAGVAKPNGFAFARNAIAVPLCISEFAAAQRCFPIVFSADDHHTPLAVLGLKQGENLIVDDGGAWRDNHYVPAYVRRYPFIVTDTPDGQEQLLAIDSDCDRFVLDAAGAADVALLFDAAGGPTSAAIEAMAFCHNFHKEHLATKAFVDALVAENLLTARHAAMQFPDGSNYALDGFMGIDDAKVRALPFSTLADWHAKGWLDLLVLYQASALSWQNLLTLNAARSSVTCEEVQ